MIPVRRALFLAGSPPAAVPFPLSRDQRLGGVRLSRRGEQDMCQAGFWAKEKPLTISPCSRTFSRAVHIPFFTALLKRSDTPLFSPLSGNLLLFFQKGERPKKDGLFS